VDWVYHELEVTVRANETLKVYAGPDVSEGAFRRMCTEAAEEQAEEELDKVEARFERKIESIEKKLSREEQELREDEAELAHRKREELGTHAETLLSLFSRRRRSVSSSLSKRRMTSRAKADVEESQEAIAQFKEELEELAAEMEEALAEVKKRWADIAADTTEIPVTPYKKDIDATLFGVAWFPFHVIQVEGRTEELAGFRVTNP
jgi:small-conductance mechanosensitive channel